MNRIRGVVGLRVRLVSVINGRTVVVLLVEMGAGVVDVVVLVVVVVAGIIDGGDCLGFTGT